MRTDPPPPRQLHLAFLRPSVPGAPDWETIAPERRAKALALLASLIARASRLGDREGACDD